MHIVPQLEKYFYFLDMSVNKLLYLNNNAKVGSQQQYMNVMFMMDTTMKAHEYKNIDLIEVLGYIGGIHEILLVFVFILVHPLCELNYQLFISSQFYKLAGRDNDGLEKDS